MLKNSKKIGVAAVTALTLLISTSSALGRGGVVEEFESHAADPNAHHVPTLDTNAATECSSGEYLDGDGSCQTIPVDTNTNAATECSPGQYLDGGGVCDMVYPLLPDLNTGNFRLSYDSNTETLLWVRVAPFQKGDTGPAGGKVFHISNGGFSGFEAAPVALTPINAIWCSSTADIAGIDNVNFGDDDSHSGAHNTPLIVAACDPGSAAELAANYVWPNGQTDGFLPNKQELILMRDNKGFIGNIFANAPYWSSTEFSGNTAKAWTRDLGGGGLGSAVKDGSDGMRKVHAIRAFAF